jgi:Flp pilus assembly protein TadG
VRDCRGVVAVQLLLLLLPLLLLLFGTFDIGLAMLTANRINFAVEAAAKCGAVSAVMCASPGRTAAYGASAAALPGLDASNFLVTTAACGMSVTATYPYAGMVVPMTWGYQLRRPWHALCRCRGSGWKRTDGGGSRQSHH